MSAHHGRHCRDKRSCRELHPTALRLTQRLSETDEGLVWGVVLVVVVGGSHRDHILNYRGEISVTEERVLVPSSLP